MIIQFQFQQYVKYYKIFYAAIEYACISMMDYEFEGIFAQRLLECTTIIRLYSLIHSNPTYLFFEQLVCFIVSFTTSYSMAYCQLIGFLVQIALRFGIRTKSRFVIWIIANYKMLTVKKQKVEGAALITSLQLLMCPITFFIMLISSILDSPYMPLLGLPIFYFSSLRPFRNTIHIQKHLSNSAEGQIYNFYLSKSYNKLLGSQPLWSHYLIRIGKYLGVVQVLEYQGGYAVIQFKGLESQDTTSCHSIEAREVDRLVNAQDCGSYFGSALTLQNQFSVPGYEENQLTLTGIIEATEFVSGFKTIYLKMLCYQAQKLTETNKKSIIELSKRFEGPEHPFPNQFADLIELKTNFLSFMSEDLEQDEGMKQQNTQHSKKQLQSNRDEITSMLEELDDDNYLQNQNLHQYQNKNFNHQQNINLSGGFYNHIQRTILYIYQVSLRDLDFNFEGRINQIVLFDLFKNSNSLFEQHQMKGVDKILSEIATLAIRSALKISLDFYSIEQHLRIEDTQLLQELEGMKECFVGMGSDEGWQKAMIQNFLLWSLGYDASQNQLKVYRQSYTNINCQVFRFDSEVVREQKPIYRWRCCLPPMMMTNVFRNIIIEGSEFPLGYAPFYSGPVVISLR